MLLFDGKAPLRCVLNIPNILLYLQAAVLKCTLMNGTASDQRFCILFRETKFTCDRTQHASTRMFNVQLITSCILSKALSTCVFLETQRSPSLPDAAATTCNLIPFAKSHRFGLHVSRSMSFAFFVICAASRNFISIKLNVGSALACELQLFPLLARCEYCIAHTNSNRITIPDNNPLYPAQLGVRHIEMQEMLQNVVGRHTCRARCVPHWCHRMATQTRKLYIRNATWCTRSLCDRSCAIKCEINWTLRADACRLRIYDTQIDRWLSRDMMLVICSTMCDVPHRVGCAVVARRTPRGAHVCPPPSPPPPSHTPHVSLQVKRTGRFVRPSVHRHARPKFMTKCCVLWLEATKFTAHCPHTRSLMVVW